MESRNNNSGFLFGLVFGAIIGAVLMTIFGTKEGKKFIKKFRRKIEELIQDVEDEADSTQKLLLGKAKDFTVKIKAKTTDKMTHTQAAREIGDKLFSKQGKHN